MSKTSKVDACPLNRRRLASLLLRRGGVPTCSNKASKEPAHCSRSASSASTRIKRSDNCCIAAAIRRRIKKEAGGSALCAETNSNGPHFFSLIRSTYPLTRVGKHAEPRCIFKLFPTVWAPALLHYTEHSLRVRHHDGDATIRRGEAGSATKDRKSTRLNSSHVRISYAVFCLKKKKKKRLSANLKLE